MLTVLVDLGWFNWSIVVVVQPAYLGSVRLAS